MTVMNLSDQFWKDFPVGLPMYYELEELLNTDWKEFGGNTSLEDQNFRIVDENDRRPCMRICRRSLRECLR